jgi:hypothetical protein
MNRSDPRLGGKAGGLMEVETGELVVFEFAMGSSRKVVARVSEYRKKTYLDLRLHFLTEEGEWMPTKKGVSCHADYLPELRQAVEAFAKALGQESAA